MIVFARAWLARVFVIFIATGRVADEVMRLGFLAFPSKLEWTTVAFRLNRSTALTTVANNVGLRATRGLVMALAC